MQRMITALGAVLVLGLGFAHAPAAEVTLRLGHQNNPGHSIHEGAVRFAELVHEKTNGEVTIEVFPSA
jgi:TRAP-type C4-dicarboxylate transport system substrate-binding protein